MSQASSQEPSQEQPAVSSQAIGNGDDQPAAPPKHPANNTTHATPRNKRSHVEVDQEPTAQDQDSSDEDAEPADQIASFDWNELENRYHHQMEHYAAQEQDLYQSFHELCKVIHSLLIPGLHPANWYSTSTSGPKQGMLTRWKEASNGTTLHTNTQLRLMTLTSPQHEDSNHARAAQRRSPRKQTPAL